MIKLKKQTCPQVLIQNKQKWTDELMRYYQNGTKPPSNVVDRYRHIDVKKAVKEDSFDKCIYCESKISHVYFGDIEHLKPKAIYHENTFEWENLGFVCGKCNNSKRDQYDENLPPINPYVEDPADFFVAFGELIFGISGNDRAAVTEKMLELNRPDLIERRRERVQMIRLLADNYSKTTNPTLKRLILKEIYDEIASDKPYSMCSKEFVRLYLGI